MKQWSRSRQFLGGRDFVTIIVPFLVIAGCIELSPFAADNGSIENTAGSGQAPSATPTAASPIPTPPATATPTETPAPVSATPTPPPGPATAVPSPTDAPATPTPAATPVPEPTSPPPFPTPLPPTPAPTPPPAAAIYVDPTLTVATTTTYNPATRTSGTGTARAYNTLSGAADAAGPGETVLIRGGTYRQPLVPANSGAAGRVLTFRNYPNETPTISGSSLAPAVNLSGKSYITIDGLHVSGVLRWMYAVKVDHIILQNCRFNAAHDESGSSKQGLFFQEATYCRIVNNTIEDCYGDSLTLIKCDRNLIEGNSMRLASHTLWTLKGASFNVIRDNYFDNHNQKIGEVYDMADVGFDHEFTQSDCTRHNVIERNSFAYTPYDARFYQFNAIQYGGQKGIIRRNRFYNCQGGGLGMHLYPPESLYNTDNRVYHNVMAMNRHSGIHVPKAANGTFRGNIFMNNILYRNLGDSGPTQIICAGLSGFLFRNNILFNEHSGETLIAYNGLRTLAWAQDNFPDLFTANLETDPAFVDEAAHDFHLSPASPAIDAGAFLTQAAAAGSGAALPVKDATFFYDGFGIPGEAGDVVQLAGQTVTARIARIDYANNVLILDRPLTWEAGQGVSLQYAGDAPDVGAYEFGLPGH